MSLLIIYAALAIVVSFICSLLEAVILSVTPAYIAVYLKSGRRSARLLNKLKANLDQSLAAILTVNTIANTIGAAGVGAQVLNVYGDGAVALASALLTVAILIFSEIIPKTLGAAKWKTLAPFCAYAITWLIYFAYPFVFLSRTLNQLFAHKNQNGLTREEMIVTAELGVDSGIIHKNESLIIRNLLMLDIIKVKDILTPRSVLLAFETEDTVQNVMDSHKPIRFSRIPVYQEDLDHVVGMVHRYKILEAASHDFDNMKIEKLMTPIHVVNDDLSVSAVLDQFVKRKDHLFLVVDAYGTTEGIVTLEDAIETLLGVEIMDEFDSVADMRAYALEKWRERKLQVRPAK